MKKSPPEEQDREKCRHCFHFKYQHINVDGLTFPCLEINATEYDAELRVIHVTDRCECFPYEPLDNLKFLEEKYEQSIK